VSWQRWNRWTLEELPELNRSVLAGRESAEILTERLRRAVLDELPSPETVSPDQACRLLVLLGLAGSSVARHYQEADPTRTAAPARSFELLAAGPSRIPFPAYFARLAAVSGTGHPPRDCYASLVRWNAPTTRVEADGETLAVLPGRFPDQETRTYTGDAGELSFFALLKKSEAFELAVNELLEPLADGSADLLGPDAVGRVLLATRLMDAMIRFNQDFAALAPERGGLHTAHFLDVFRQFAVHWELGDLPPTGAQDPQFLRRDFLLGIDFPDYAKHVRRIYPSLLESERTMLERQSVRPPLPTALLASLGLDAGTLSRCKASSLRALVREHPQLAAWYLLLAANAKFGAVHLMLTEKFLFKPQRTRDASGEGDREPVSNRRGTTGMAESLLVRLTQGRRNHPLRFLGQLPHRELSELCGTGTGTGTALEDLPTVRFTAPV
jgi:hypothetical protein